MASSKGMAPGVLLPTVPMMGSSAAVRPTKGSSTSKVVRVSTSSRRTTPKARPPRIKVARPKMPKDANALRMPKAKRVKNGKEFSVKRKPVI